MAVSPPRSPAPAVDRRALRRRGQLAGPASTDGSDRTTLRREYVAGGSGRGRHFQPTVPGPHTLPHPFDDLTTDFGNDVYQEMLADAQVAACLVVLKASILEDGVVLAPAVPDQADPRHDDACEIAEMATAMLEGLDTPLDDVLWTMLDAYAYGNKIAELVYRVESVLLPPEKLPPPPPLPQGAPPASTAAPPGSSRPDGGGTAAPEYPDPPPMPPRRSKLFLNLARIKPKPRQHVAFVVDDYLNVVGVMGVRPGPSLGYLPTNEAVDPADPRVLPRAKFAVLTCRPEDGDPRGTSVLRPAYEPWWRKRSITGEYLAYLSQFAGPSLWAATATGAQTEPLADALGNPIAEDDDPLPPDPADVPSPEARLFDALQIFRNGSVLVVPGGTEVHAIEMQGDGEPFLLGFAQCDQQITKAILTQTLATEEGQHQARAAASVHQDVLDTLVKQGKKAVVRMLTVDILKPWVLLNYGADAARELVPVPSLGTTEQRDLAPMWTAAAGLKRAGYLADSQLPAVDARLGLPVRDLTAAPVPPVVLPLPADDKRPAPTPPGDTPKEAPDGSD